MANNPIATALGVQNVVEVIPYTPVAVTENDVEEARASIVELARKASGSVEEMFSILQAMNDPKMYSAAASFIKAVADVNERVIKIAEKKSPETNDAKVVNNNVFFGSTTSPLEVTTSPLLCLLSFLH